MARESLSQGPAAAPALGGRGQSSWVRWFIRLTAFVGLFHVVLAYGLPPAGQLALFIVLAWWYTRIGAAESLAVTVSLVLVTLILVPIFKLAGLDRAIYYRPHERFATYNAQYGYNVYINDVDIEMQMPHGDLQAMTGEDIAVPRRVHFQTDKDGYRNARPYHGQRYVLVGDSFIAGTGNSNEDSLAAQLLSEHGLDTYSLGYPGDPDDYVRGVAGFRQRYGDDFRLILFLFEGNDFAVAGPSDAGRDESRPDHLVKRSVKGYFSMFSDTTVYRTTKSLYKRLQYRQAIRESTQVVFAQAKNGERIAFYRSYVDVTREPSYQPAPQLELAVAAMAPKLSHVFFIPTKYRVYHPMMPDGAAALPTARWDYLEGLCRRYTIPCTDLTEALQAATGEPLRPDTATWWPDDTHWNRRGIAVAAAAVAEVIR